jgi:DNA-binding transcriptional MerR regulator
VETWTIGEAAARFGLRASALRYYEELGLVTPVARERGKRIYDRVQLRRLAYVCTGRELGLPLDGIRRALDGSGHRWRDRARELLTHTLECDSPHPITGCPRLLRELDRAVDGG